jgi:hypothetical protein
LLAALATLSTACGPANELGGSIGESFALDFDKVRIRKQDTALLIEYLKFVGAATSKVCKVVIETDGLGLKADKEIKGEKFLTHVFIQREAQTGYEFPDLAKGSIQFGDYGFKDGATVNGEFYAKFVNGRGIEGRFDGKVQEVSTE